MESGVNLNDVIDVEERNAKHSSDHEVSGKAWDEEVGYSKYRQ